MENGKMSLDTKLMYFYKLDCTLDKKSTKDEVILRHWSLGASINSFGVEPSIDNMAKMLLKQMTGDRIKNAKRS